MSKNKTIEQLKQQVAALIPAGWRASECFSISMEDLSTSPVMVTAYRPDAFKVMPPGISKEERLAWRKQRQQEVRAEAALAETILKEAGLKVSRDGGSVYVRL